MKFWKEVIRPGTYYPLDASGQRKEVTISRNRIDHWAKTLKAMVQAGNRIPVPYHHTDDAVPIAFDSTSPSTYDCAGYALDAYVDPSGALQVLIEPATEEDEKNFNTRVKDVSIRTNNWLDGAGKAFNDAITHIAACFHPIMTQQKPFVPAEGMALSLTMAADYTENGPEGNKAATNSLESVCQLLAEHGFDVGDDVTPENFIERLGTALRAVKSWKEKEAGEEDDLEQKPEGAKTQKPTPIAMSNDLLEFALQTTEQQPNNPSTGKPWKATEIEAAYKLHQASQPKLQLSAEHQAAYNLLQANNKKMIADRLSACVKNMTMQQDVAEELLEVVEVTELQFSADGTVDEAKHREVFLPLRMAEKANPGAVLTGQNPSQVRVAKERLKLSLGTEEHPDGFEGGNEPLTEEQARANADRLLSRVM